MLAKRPPRISEVKRETIYTQTYNSSGIEFIQLIKKTFLAGVDTTLRFLGSEQAIVQMTKVRDMLIHRTIYKWYFNLNLRKNTSNNTE